MRDIQTTIMGNATADPSAHQQEDGSVTAKLRIAVTGRYYNAAQQDYSDRKTEFITVFVRRQAARNVLQSVRKGQPLIVSGRLHTSEWTGEDGATRFSLNLQAETVGHDLTYGTAVFRRPLRGADTPDIDPDTGDVVDLGEAPTKDSEESEDSSDNEVLTGERRSEGELTPAPF